MLGRLIVVKCGALSFIMAAAEIAVAIPQQDSFDLDVLALSRRVPAVRRVGVFGCEFSVKFPRSLDYREPTVFRKTSSEGPLALRDRKHCSKRSTDVDEIRNERPSGSCC